MPESPVRVTIPLRRAGEMQMDDFAMQPLPSGQRASSEELARCRCVAVIELLPGSGNDSGAQRQLFAGRTPVGNAF